jgi:hypothetical protein
VTIRPNVGPIGTPRPDEPADMLILCWLWATIGLAQRLELYRRATRGRRETL